MQDCLSINELNQSPEFPLVISLKLPLPGVDVVTTVTCSTSKVTVAHPLWVRVLCQVTVQYELPCGFVILARTCSIATSEARLAARRETHRHILGSSPLGVSTLSSPPEDPSYSGIK